MRPTSRKLSAVASETGSITVAAALSALACVVLIGALAVVAGAMSAHHRAQSLADLGALAAARYAAEGERVACDFASVSVRRAVPQSRVTRCELHSFDATVTVSSTARGLFGSLVPVRAVATAGPIE